MSGQTPIAGANQDYDESSPKSSYTNSNSLILGRFVNNFFWSKLLVVICILSCLVNVHAQKMVRALNFIKPLDPDDPKGLALPPGVPRTVDTNGNVIALDVAFSSTQYQRAAFKLVLEEANRVAREMQLPENLPITVSNITEAYISPFGCSYRTKAIGNITTSNYVYYVSKDKKFNNLGIVNYDQTCLKLIKQKLPVNQLDTNAAYQLATQWLESASMDVKGLNRDCKLHIAVSAYWNGLGHIGDVPMDHFVPMYYIWWTSPENDAAGHGDVAYVELYLPTKQLLQLDVHDTKYILRKQLVFPDLASLFPGKAPILVVTNASASTNEYVYIAEPK